MDELRVTGKREKLRKTFGLLASVLCGYVPSQQKMRRFGVKFYKLGFKNMKLKVSGLSIEV